MRPPAGSSPSCRNGELWASNVQWTDKAAGMLKAREARYVSPAFNYEDDGAITELVNVALTNIPATKKQTPPDGLARAGAARPSQEGEEHEEQAPVRHLRRLGLSADSDDASVIARLNALAGPRPRRRRPGEGAKETEGKLNAITGKQSFGESLGVVQSWKDSAGTVVSLSQKITELEQKGRETEVLALVDAGVKDGKIAPAQKEMWLERGKKDPEFLKGFLSTASKVVPARRARPRRRTQPRAPRHDEQKKGRGEARHQGPEDPRVDRPLLG